MVSPKLFLCFVYILISSFVFTSPVKAADMNEVLKRLDALEKENSALKAEIYALKQIVISDIPVEVGEKVITNKAPVDIKLYGYIKADGIWEDSAGGELLYNASSEVSSIEDDEFNFSARETRLGLAFSGPEFGYDGKVSGKIETDFFGGSEGSPEIRMRQAYVKLSYPEWNVLAGQAWDFFSPLGPSTLNFAYGWRWGNLGDRHPQLVLSNKFDYVLGGTVTTKLGLMDIQNDAQEKNAVPLSGGYIKYATDIMDMPSTIALGGIWGQTQNNTANSPGKNLDIWAGTLGMTIKVNDLFSLKTEGYVGANLAAFRSTNNSGIDHHKSVRSRGGFTEFKLTPTDVDEVNLGVGMDDLFTDLVTTSGTNWEYNYSLYANYKRSLSKNLILGLEYQFVRTKFSDKSKGDKNRVQTSVIYKF